MATRLPNPGSDDGVWGALLNDYLSVEHNADGTLKKASDISTALSTANAAYVKPGAGIPKADLSAGVRASLDNADAAAAGTVADATTTSRGIIQLTGDLGGTATAPVIATGAVGATKLANGAVSNAHISGSAAIDQSKINNLTADLSAKANSSHSHVIADVANLQTLLNGKADSTSVIAADAYGVKVALWNGSNYQVGGINMTSGNRISNMYYRFVGGPDPTTVGLTVSNGDEWKSV